MRRNITWLIAVAAGFLALPVGAADFEAIELWVDNGWIKGGGLALRGDGTLRIDRPDHPDERDAETCIAHVTKEELDSVSRLVAQIPDEAPWGRQWILQDNCFDETEATLLVSTSRGELDIRHSVDCRPPEVPAWVTNIYETLRKIQQRYEVCGKPGTKLVRGWTAASASLSR